MRTLDDWLAIIEQFHPSSIQLGLERVTPIAEQLKLKNFACPVVIVGGTNGKGSIVRTLEHLYFQAGYKVGAYTSPHLLQFNERIRINMQEVKDADLIQAFEIINEAHQKDLSFFEFTTLAALYLFQQASLDILILEVGLGGRLDAVNVVDADVAVISSIGIDHTDWLGPDRESIGFEKAGIFRSQKVVVCGDLNPPQSILNRADELRVEFYCLGKDFHYHHKQTHWDWYTQEQNLFDLPLPSLKCQNVATALMVIHALQKRCPISSSLLYKEIGKLSLTGRFEQIQHESHSLILDVAHNPDSTAWLAEQLTQLQPQPRRILAVVAMLKDKPIYDSLAYLIPCVDEWFVAGLSDIERGATSQQISTYLEALQAKVWYNFSSVIDAVRAAIKACKKEDCIVIFGSFYTVARAKKCLKGKK